MTPNIYKARARMCLTSLRSLLLLLLKGEIMVSITHYLLYLLLTEPSAVVQPVVALDFGTTNSAIAVADAGKAALRALESNL